jgi:hypothetical protein
LTTVAATAVATAADSEDPICDGRVDDRHLLQDDEAE